MAHSRGISKARRHSKKRSWVSPGPVGFEPLESRHLLATLAVPPATTQINSVVYDGADSIVKQGGGTLVLSAPNRHAGGTIVAEGTLVVRGLARLSCSTAAAALSRFHR